MTSAASSHRLIAMMVPNIPSSRPNQRSKRNARSSRRGGGGCRFSFGEGSIKCTTPATRGSCAATDREVAGQGGRLSLHSLNWQERHQKDNVLAGPELRRERITPVGWSGTLAGCVRSRCLAPHVAEREHDIQEVVARISELPITRPLRARIVRAVVYHLFVLQLEDQRVRRLEMIWLVPI